MASLYSSLEQNPKYGLTIARSNFTDSDANELIDKITASDAYQKLPDFDDKHGSVGHVVWRQKDDPEIPPHITRATKLIGSKKLDISRLRAVQFNTQLPQGVQDFHTDTPFSSSLTMHLSPNGKFDYKDQTGEVISIDVGVGDIMFQTKANTLSHRGRNSSKSTRFTIAMFFNGQAFDY